MKQNQTRSDARRIRQMKFLQQLNEGQQLAAIRDMSAKAIEMAFVANYVAALTILRAGDINGLMHIRSRGIDRLAPSMSRVDFWGYVLFKASRNELKKFLDKAVVDELKVDTGRLIETRVRKIIDSLKKPADLQNWMEIVYTVKLLQIRFEVPFPALNTILSMLYSWQDMGVANRMNGIGQATRFLMMADPRSPLMSVMRDLTSGGKLFKGGFALGAATDVAANKISRIFRLNEEGDGGEGGGDAGGGEGGGVEAGQEATMAGAIATLPKMLFKNGKIIKRKTKKYKVRRFKDPVVNKALGDYSNVRAT